MTLNFTDQGTECEEKRSDLLKLISLVSESLEPMSMHSQSPLGVSETNHWPQKNFARITGSLIV